MSKIIHLSIPSMKCGGCVSSIEKALSNETSITEYQVNLDTKRVWVETDSALAVLVGTFKAAGFDATEVPQDEQEKS